MEGPDGAAALEVADHAQNPWRKEGGEDAVERETEAGKRSVAVADTDGAGSADGMSCRS